MMVSVRTHSEQKLLRCGCGKDSMFEFISTEGRPVILCTNCGHCPYLPDALEIRIIRPPFPWKEILKSLPNNGLFFLLALTGVCLLIAKLMR